MRCRGGNSQLSALCDGELTGSQRERLRAHLGSCRRCAEDLKDIETMRALMRALPQPEPRPDFWEATHRQIQLAAVRDRPALPARHLRLGWAAAAGTALLLATLTMPTYLGRESAPLPVIGAASLESLHTNLRVDRPLEDHGALRNASAESSTIELANGDRSDAF